MTNNDNAGHDTAIQRPEDDLLNGSNIARSIHRMIRTTPPTWSSRIGLYGTWGSGKTSILNLLRLLEEKDGSLVLSLSAWSVSDESEVVALIYEMLEQRLRAEGIESPFKQKAKKVTNNAKRFGWFSKLTIKGIEEWSPAPAAITKIATSSVSELATFALRWAKIDRKDIEKLRQRLNGRRVVIFIDDLDRADPRVLPKTFLALKEVLDWPGFTFVLAFDKKVVSKALSEYSAAFSEDIQGFLEKVIDVPFEVPEPNQAQKRKLAGAAFNACCDLIPKSSLDALIPHLPDQPRKIKLLARMIGALKPALERHDPSEVDWYALSLYLMLLESNRRLANWVVNTTQTRDRGWTLWLSDSLEKEKNENIAKDAIRAILNNPAPPPDLERLTEIALDLLKTWEMCAEETIRYWTNLSSQEPGITTKEFRVLLNDFLNNKSIESIKDRLERSQIIAGIDEEEALIELLFIAHNHYQNILSKMAESRTQLDWNAFHQDANNALNFIEFLWRDFRRSTSSNVFSRGLITASLVGLCEEWVSWTRNDGENKLRTRELQLVTEAIAACDDPEKIYSDTDPLWNTNHGYDAESSKKKEEWKKNIRACLTPEIIKRLLDKFSESDGLLAIATGEDHLRTWLIESKTSPLYTESNYSAALVDLLRNHTEQDLTTRVVIGQNALLYLKQLLFQNRNASWGGIDSVKEINKNNPAIIPAAWEAAIENPVPFRMRSSLRELRENLIECGVDANLLLNPEWLLLKN